jgi:hypothetical protein
MDGGMVKTIIPFFGIGYTVVLFQCDLHREKQKNVTPNKEFDFNLVSSCISAYTPPNPNYIQRFEFPKAHLRPC